MPSSISDGALMVSGTDSGDNRGEKSQPPARFLPHQGPDAGQARSPQEHTMSNSIKSVLLLGTMTALLVFIGQIIGGNTGMILAFGLAVVMNIGSYWFSDQIALRMAGAREVSPE